MSTEERGRRCVFVGDELLVSQCAEIAREHGLEPVAVVSTHSVALQHARDLGIDAVHSDGDSDLFDLLSPFAFDVLFSIAYERIIARRTLDLAQLAINFHDGLLPGYGGLNVTTWSIHHGEAEHGVTWHLMDDLADRGDVLVERRFPIRPDDTALALNARCYEAGLSSFGDVATRVASGSLDARAQPDGERRMFRRTERPPVLVEADGSAVQLERTIRAIDTGPRMRQAMGGAHCRFGEIHALLGDVELVVSEDDARPGRVVRNGDAVRLTLNDGDLLARRVLDPQGRTVDPAALVSASGGVFGGVSARERSALIEHDPQLSANEAWWTDRLSGVSTASAPMFEVIDREADWRSTTVPVGDASTEPEVVAAIIAWLQVVGGGDSTVVAVSDEATRERVSSIPFVRLPLVAFERLDSMPIGLATSHVVGELATALEHGPWLADVVGRDPVLRGEDRLPSVVLHLGASPGQQSDSVAPGVDVEFFLQTDATVTMRHRLDPDVALRAASQIGAAFTSISSRAARSMGDVDAVSELDRHSFDAWNDTEVEHDRTRTIDGMFRAQVARTPDLSALSCGDETLTYADLSTQVAEMSALLGAAGVARGDVVGVALDRGINMVVSVLAALGVGAHYLPLDPGYPDDRLAFMVTDSGAQVVVGDPDAGGLGAAVPGLTFIDPIERRALDDVNASSAPGHEPSDLAYVIYTSGSTGTPKGVQLEHRQVVNFFTAMDRIVGPESERQVWLAVTSLSFDISVLELLWPLTNGGHVVVKPSSGFATRSISHTQAAAATARQPQPRRTHSTDMSLFYFAAGAGQAENGYRLLMEGARWADEHGFAAIWTPERHFHHFGAPYPNPSVIAAALATATERVAIRAGSVVAPLHSPIRVAEEWAVVDNLSRGRVGVSFAAGWQPNDFVLNPGAYADARDSLPGLVDTVRRLWRGETVEVPGHDGVPIPVATLPRPVQAELPVWLTSAGSPASFERAGSLGYNVLTHLVGQTLEQLAENIERYRTARRRGGHEGDGHVTLMLHAYLHDDADHAREVARQPLKGYLGTAVGLLKDLASAFPTFGGAGADADEAFRSLTEEEVSQLLDHATDRYLSTAGLFGSVDDGLAMARSVVDIGVDEIACLIDFGIDDDAVLDGLALLDQVHQRLDDDVDSNDDDDVVSGPSVADSIGGLIEQHGVTHLQCTPSLASMLVANPDDRAALRSLRHLMVGGEALAPALGGQLLDLVPGRVTNMYGPTETTIWSLVHDLDRAAVSEASVPIGKPIANTTMCVLDPHGRQVPVGVLGELHLGGEGVARGYHARPELTAERFVERPGTGRTYATGDVVRVRSDGVVEFGGRRDGQVKIRGHRIELTEIESVIDALPTVVQSVVTATDGSEPSLVAYVVGSHDRHTELPGEVRDHVRALLPDVMVPSAIVVVEAFPLTPNGKIDRKRLVAPDLAASPVPSAVAPAASESESAVAEIWAAQLGRAVGRNDNFFDVGGHSLLAVKVYRELTDRFGADLALTDVFRFPTVATFAAHVDAASSNGSTVPDDSPAPALQGARRGEMRRRARNRRTVADD